MTNVARDEIREERITIEIVMDAYGPEEQAMSWYYYLEDQLAFPFQAWCINARRTSPLRVNQIVEVLATAPEDECLREMFVEVQQPTQALAVPLAQLEPIAVEEQTQQGIADWNYWVARGYQSG